MVAGCLFLWRPNGVCFCDCEGKEKVQTAICRLLTTSAPFATGTGLILIVIPLLNGKDLLHFTQRRM